MQYDHFLNCIQTAFFAYCGIQIEAEEMHPYLFSPCVIGEFTPSKCWLLASKHTENR